MRYTECRLTAAAELLLDGIDEKRVDFKPTYDESDTEPMVLPGGFPEPAGQRFPPGSPVGWPPPSRPTTPPS
jgi:hypothetical protein